MFREERPDVTVLLELKPVAIGRWIYLRVGNELKEKINPSSGD